MKTKCTLFLLILFTGIFASVGANAQDNSESRNKFESCDFRTEMRQLWEDHVTWTRNVILNFTDSLPGTGDAVARLLQNQVDIGNAIKPYYGNAAGNQLTAHLTTHILIAADILTALNAGNTAAFNNAYANWFLNADTIANLLASVNPNWDAVEMRNMMHHHLNATTDEVLARLNQDYAADVAAYDDVHIQILAMADMLSEGIIQQFPGKFKNGNGASKRSSQVVALEAENVVLEQNSPNPFSGQTVINYFVPEDIHNAQIRFFDATGRLIKAVPISEPGEGELILETEKLASGLYSYQIIADGRVMDTRKMVRH